MFKIRCFVPFLAVVIALSMAPTGGVNAGIQMAALKLTATPRPSRTPRPPATPIPSRTPTPAPTMLSDPVMVMGAPRTCQISEPRGFMTFTIPENWFWMDMPSGVVVANDVAAGFNIMSGQLLENDQIGGIIFFMPQDKLRNFGLKQNAKPVDFVQMAFHSFRNKIGANKFQESKPALENFVLNDKQGAATVFHCPSCRQDENYLVAVKAEGGFAWMVFEMTGLKVDQYRNTMRTIAASVEFIEQ